MRKYACVRGSYYGLSVIVRMRGKRMIECAESLCVSMVREREREKEREKEKCSVEKARATLMKH